MDLKIYCKFYLLHLIICTYIRILGNWANYCKYKIIIPSPTKRYEVTSSCSLIVDELFIIVIKSYCIL